MATMNGARAFSGNRKDWLVAGLVGVSYFAAAGLGFAFNREQGLAVPFWVGNAILLTALLRQPRAAWPLLVIAAAVGLAAANVLAGTAPGLSAIFIAANMAETLTAALMLRPREREFELAERIDAVGFILVCGLVAPLVSTALAALTVIVRPGGFTLSTALTWFTAEALGLVIVTPALWLAVGARRSLAGEPARVGLFLTLIVGLAAVMAVTAYFPGHMLPLLTLPLLGYLTVEFGVVGAAGGMLATALFSFAAAILTLYISAPNPPIRLILQNMELFLAGISIFVLPLGVIVDDKKRIQDTLINYLAGEMGKGAAPAPASTPAEPAITAAAFCDRSGLVRIIARGDGSSPAEIMDGRLLSEFVDPRSVRALDAALEAAIDHATGPTVRRLRCRLRIGQTWAPAALTILSVRHEAGQGAEAMVLFETGEGGLAPVESLRTEAA